MLYSFAARLLPMPARRAVESRQLQLLPPFFASRLPSRPAGQGAAGVVLNNLVLGAWEYYLFSFCLWPLSEAGERALETPTSTAAPVGGVLSMGGGAAAEPPLYIGLLSSYLRYFVPCGVPLTEHGQLLLVTLSQFWLCQNPPPQLKSHFKGMPFEFQDTHAPVLACLDSLVAHLNAHEKARIRSASGSPSAHGLLLSPLYHFYNVQLESLPDTSARVISLIRLTTKYLEPWRAPTPKGTPASAAAGGQAGGMEGTAAAAVAAAESWEWCRFVRTNYVLYVRLLISVSKECQSSRFSLSAKRDLQMLREALGLFDSRLLLTLLRQMGEASERLLKGTLPHTSPLRAPLVEALLLLEGEGGWQRVCEAHLPAEIYKTLDSLDSCLRTQLERMRKESSVKGFFDGAASATAFSPAAAIDELRRSVQRALRELQPAGPEGAPPAARPVAMGERRAGVAALSRLGAPLSADEKRQLSAGRARCSALAVPFRASPRMPVRPVGAMEIRFLVPPLEYLGSLLPPSLPRIGIHPRILASPVAIGLSLALAFLYHLNPTNHGIDSPTLTTLWTLLMLPVATLALLYARRWASLHAPSQPAALETWVPWICEQLANGVKEIEVREHLRRALPPANHGNGLGRAASGGAHHIDDMIQRAKDRLAN